MSYENTDIREYSWGVAETVGATTVLHYIVGPRGKVGFVRDISVDVTTALVGTGGVPEIDIGFKSGDFTYGRYRLGVTAILGYPVGLWTASNEAITGNPPRTLQDYAGHIQLDGYPLGNVGIAGGSFSTVAPLGRIPASGNPITNVVNGTANNWRVFLRDPLPPALLVGTTGFLVNVSGVVGGVTGGTAAGIRNAAVVAPVAAALANNWIELPFTFGGAYTGGGFIDFVTVVTELAGTTGPAGAGAVRVVIEWVGANTP